MGTDHKEEREQKLVSENSDIFTCQPNDNLNLDADAFKSSEIVNVESREFNENNLICIVSTVSGQIKGRPARVEIFDDADVASEQGSLNVKLFVKLQEPLTLKSSEQIILQCPTGKNFKYFLPKKKIRQFIE